MGKKVSSESFVKDIRRKTRKKYSSEEKIRIVLLGLRGEDSIAGLCCREGIPAILILSLEQRFLGGRQKRRMGDTDRVALEQTVTLTL